MQSSKFSPRQIQCAVLAAMLQNPDREKRSRPTLGHQMILGLKPNAGARFEGSRPKRDLIHVF
jgi:hypothetical protein